MLIVISFFHDSVIPVIFFWNAEKVTYRVFACFGAVVLKWNWFVFEKAGRHHKQKDEGVIAVFHIKTRLFPVAWK